MLRPKRWNVIMSLISFGKKLIKKNPSLTLALAPLHNGIFGFNRKRINGKMNKIHGINGSFLTKTKIRIIGNNNVIEFGHTCFLQECNIFILGDNNHVILGDKFYGIKAEFWLQDDNNFIEIGEGTTIGGLTHLATTEGTKISIGKDCMFSSDIAIRTGDSHAIYTKDTTTRINPALDVLIGDHVWLGNKTILLKGTQIPDDSIVGSGAIVTNKFLEPNIVIAGTPGRVIKENIHWTRDRIS